MSSKFSFGRKLVGFAATLTLVGGLAACAGAPATSGSPADDGEVAEELQQVTIGLPLQSTTFASVYLATQEAIWEENGLDVEILTFQGDAPLVQAVLSGDVDIAVASLTGVMNVRSSGQDVAVFYGGFNQTAFAWYSTPDIKSVEDAEGKTWGITSLGSSTDFLTRYAVSQSGLDPDTDIDVIQGGGSAARLAAMEAGQIDVNILTAPFDIEAEKKGFNKILALGDIVDSYPMHVSWSTSEWLNDNENIAEKFVGAMEQSMQMVHDEPELAAGALSDEIKITIEQAEASIASWIDELHPDGRMVSDEGLQAFWDMGVEGGLFEKEIPESEWLDDRFLPTSK